jgi:ABC-2 type transport system ATP-binding protein
VNGGEAAPLAVERVSRWFGNVVAVNDITFALGPGVTGLLGPNGAGKSTLLHMMSGFLRPSSGRVTVRGEDAWLNPGMYSAVGIVPERDALFTFMTGFEFVLMNARLQKLQDPVPATQRAIATVGLQDAQHRACGGYSKGMRQRLKVAAGIIHDPDILLLDEPFNGMDPGQRLQMMDTLTAMAAAGRTVLFSSHILEEVERLAQRILVIVAGRLAASGDYREIRRLMTDRPHSFTVKSSDNRRLAVELLRDGSIFGVEVTNGRLTARTADFGAFTASVARVARESGVSLYELIPADESLESVFTYLVKR